VTSLRYIIREIALAVGTPEEALARTVAEFLRIPVNSLSDLRIVRKSLDARARNRPLWRYAVEFSCARPLQHPRVSVVRPAVEAAVPRRPLPGPSVAIVGSGPAGLGAALGLARKGYKVTVFEMGRAVIPRFRDIRLFIKQNKFDAKSNILFGLGGAGTFSDGKLTARTRNEHTAAFLRELVASGADPSIEYLHHPHIGTDRLQFIVDKFRVHCEEAGCEFRFEAEVSDLVVEEGACRGVVVNGEALPFDAVVLAPGLSAHALYKALEARGVAMERKAFAVGVRVEHPQDLINKRQLGDQVDAGAVGAAEYFLTWQNAAGDAAYSFCMCPGGVVVPCADAEGALFTNGMSYSNRATPFANSAVVATVNVDALPGGVLAGVDYQRKLERDAYALGGGEYRFPVQTIAAYVEKRLDSGEFPKTSFQKPMRWANFWELFDSQVANSLYESFLDFERKIPGFVKTGFIIGPESRTSSPVRIPRDPDTLESVNVARLYPIGEGAGYSGGIVSSGADGVRLADLVSEWKAA
jgi:uncharacterized FAD-dependent dehydrogenase